MKYTTGNLIKLPEQIYGTWVGMGRRLPNTEIHSGTYRIMWVGNNRVRIAEVFPGGTTSTKYVYLLPTDELLAAIE